MQVAPLYSTTDRLAGKSQPGEAMARATDDGDPDDNRSRPLGEWLGDRAKWLVTVCAGYAAMAGLFGYWKWTGPTLMPGHVGVPMAPSTAALLTLLGLSIAAQPHLSSRSIYRVFVHAFGTIAVVTALFVIARDVVGFGRDWSFGLPEVATTADGAPVGRMSPYTATALLFIALAQQAILSSRRSCPVPSHAAMLGATAVLLFAALSVVAYVVGAPLLAGTGVVPMALSTSGALAALASGLLILGRSRAPTRELLTTVQGKLLASFAALLLLLVFVATVAYVEFTAARGAHRQVIERNYAAIVDLGRLRGNLNAERLDVSLMFDFPAPRRAAFRRDHDERVREDEQILQRLRRLLADDPESLRILTSLIALRTEFEGICEGEILPALERGDVALAKPLYLGRETDRHQRLRKLTRALETRETLEGRATADKSDRRAALAVVILVGAGGISIFGALAVALFTYRAVRQAHQAVEQASAYHRTLIEVSLDPLVTIGPDGRIMDVNAATENATGRPRTALIGTDFSDYFTDPELARVGYQQVFRDGNVHDFPLELRHQDGSTRSVLYNASVYRDADGKALGVFAAARDVTERKRAEEQIRNFAAELERSNQELERFAYVASHDLQEPLRTVRSFSQLLAQRYQKQLDRNANEFIAFIVGAVDRMQRLIEDLLAFSRVGTRGRAFTKVDVTSVLNVVTAALATAISETHAQITADPLPEVSADEGQLTQVVQNLIGNAIKFRRPGVVPKVHVGAIRVSDGWEFSVCDNGIGIEPQYFDRIFIIFQRLHGGDEYPGTGIGLAICKKIIERHGGHIRVESQPNAGATFRFTLPDVPPSP